MVTSVHKPRISPRRIGSDITNEVQRRQKLHQAPDPKKMPHLRQVLAGLSGNLPQTFYIKGIRTNNVRSS